MALTQVVHHIDGKLGAEVRRFLAGAPKEAGACGEHDPGWLRVLSESLGHRTMAVVAREASGELVGYLPLALVTSRLFGRYLVSLPYLNRAGVVAVDEGVRGEVLDVAAGLADRFAVRYLELRHQGGGVEHGSITESRGDKVQMMMGLPGDGERLWSGYSAKVRNQVRKGDKAGLTIRFGGAELLDGFYDVFSTNMRDLGTPVYPRRLFGSVLDTFKDGAELAVVSQGGRAVAGALLLHSCVGDAVETRVPSASSLRDAKHTNANMWMYHRLLMRAVSRGAGVFDFGRSTPDSGTYRFKKQWGAVPSGATWQYYLRAGDVSAVRPDNPKYRRRIATWQKLPVWVTRLVGPAIVKGIP
jgi:FemAB-related protein (PEP-CTERM system-associated)